ncbi:2-hydroxyacid dehydrogenase [Thiospirochaeta perfilievii]|uniref:2-hydroxyacid dehydrogenase n=1 Tax=Thiospirochaeta perfilievii TaxID=252967 RepID=A0A5C1QE27_9SPIO|nr:2-hydroxyacid dehydrogenase [Thiospirochaeta perfilievii]QEN05239.1 2-hydroxyacid dehydrogenase [Thiospirochaeta perfilievii]
MKIVFYDSKQYDIDSFEKENRDFNYKLKFLDFKLTIETVELAKGYDAVCVFVNDIITEPIITRLHELGIKIIALRCAGYNNIDFKSAFNKVHVVRVPSYSPYAVAEHAMALIMTLNRKTHKAYNRTKESNFNIGGLMGFDLYKKNIGVIGTGKIGQKFIDIANGFGMNVLAYDKFPNTNLKVTYCDLDTLYRESDIISLHCPLLKETEHIINRDSIKKMKDGVMIINTSRGGLIDAKDLINGLKSRKIGSAGLDVYEEEAEYFFEDFSNDMISDDKLARLISFPNVLITSHQAFLTNEALKNIANTTLNNIKNFKDKEYIDNEVCYQCKQFGKCSKDEKKPCF